MPIVSVIIPVYNGEKTIQKTIETVLSQTMNDFELIVINSGSTDLTLNIISQIQDSRLQVFSYPQANVAVNRNRGFNHSRSKFITFLDADDLWTADKLEAQYKALLENPEAGVVYSWTDCVDETGKFLRKCSYVKWAGDVYPQLLLDDFIGNGSNVMIRREAFEFVGGFDESLTNAEDTDICLRLAAKYQFVNISKVQVFYRIYSNSKSSNILPLEKSNLAVIQKAYTDKKAAKYQHFKKYSLANLYKYLSYKALDASPGQQKTLHAIRFLFYAVYTDPLLLFKPVLFKAFIKLFLMAIIPNKLCVKILNKFTIISNTSTFMGYEKTYQSLF
ncbi:MAG: glycosyltransferase [Nostocaceae cyanobacterium]|nr:glycosyltransferase [Nostocaceae cyanobacterium]